MKWTPKQQEAIEECGRDILVSASAGSGKTAVLSERVLYLMLKNRIDIDKFVIATFTNLAANEMKQRILEKIENIRKENPDDKFIEKQTMLIDKAPISTLHSFGLKLIKDYFYIIGLEPNVGMIDDIDLAILKRDTMTQIFDEYYKQNNEVFLNLIKIYGNIREDEGAKEQINIMYDFIMNMPNPNKALDDVISIYTDDVQIEDTIHFKYLIDEIYTVVLEFIREGEEYINDSESIEIDLGKLKNIAQIIESKTSDMYTEIKKTLDIFEFDRIKIAKDLDDETKKLIKTYRDDLKSYIKKLSEKYFVLSKEALKDEMNTMKDYMNMLKELTSLYKDRLAEEKRKRNVIDFNDIEHFTHDLLIDHDGNLTELANELRSEYRYVIVDEYQDINELQESILRCISTYNGKEHNMFMVGDVKQSIYRFRKADPEIFSDKYNSFNSDKTDLKPDNLRIDLNQNFRSRVEVLDSTNFIFEKIMNRKIGGIDYDENMKLVYGELYRNNDSIDYRAEINYIEDRKIKPNEDGEIEEDIALDNTAKTTKVELEAMFIVQRINELMGNTEESTEKFKVYDMKKDDFRDVDFKDMVILLRGVKGIGRVYYDKLKENNIPALLMDEEDFLDTEEISFIINILKILDNNLDDIPLVSVLYSPVYNINPKELKKIKDINSSFKNYYLNIIEYLKHGEDEVLKGKLQFFIDTILSLKELAKKSTITKIIETIYKETRYKEYIINQDNIAKAENVEYLLEYTARYEEKNNNTLYEFLTNIEKIKGSNSKIQVERSVSAGNAVKIMTIHKSKGLEYPVVFLPLSKKFNNQDIKKKILYDKKMGLASEYINPEKLYSKENFYKEIIKEKITIENLAEEMRILYVALTRAREKLIMIGSVSVKDDEEVLDKWSNIIGDNGNVKHRYLKKCNSYIDLIGPISTLVKDDDKNIKINIIKEIHENKKATNRESIKNLINETCSGEYEKWIYDYIESTDKKNKISVTELKKEHMRESNAENSLDNSIETKKDFKRKQDIFKVEDTTLLVGAKRGTLLHKLFKVVKGQTKEEILDEFTKLSEAKIFKREDLDQLDINKILEYTNSKLFREIETSKLVKREMPFMMKKKLSEVYKDINNDDYFIIQGIVDCAYEDKDGSIVILDYKTDKIKCKNEDELNARVEELKTSYKMQLDLYEEALSEIFKKPISKKILYLYEAGICVEV